ncbi:MAG: Gldg family protein [Planctomycetota bacterium]
MLRIWQPRHRRLKVGLNVALQIVCVIWLLLVLNVFAFRHSWRTDLTQDQRYDLPADLRSRLTSLDHAIEVVVPFHFTKSQLLELQVFGRALRILTELEQVQPGGPFRVAERLDVNQERERWDEVKRRYNIERFNRIYLLYQDRREELSVDDLARLPAKSERSPQASLSGPQYEDRVVTALTAAIYRLLSGEQIRIAFSQGHGEPPPEILAALTTTLSSRAYAVESLDLRRAERVPDGIRALALVCVGVTSARFEPFERNGQLAIEDFLRRGGSVLMFLPPQGPSGLEVQLAGAGIRALPGIVCSDDPAPGGRSDSKFLYVSDVSDRHPAGRGVARPDFRAEILQTRALEVTAPADALLLSPAESWLERDLRRFQRDADDPTGAFCVVAASEVKLGAAATARFVVVGSAFAATDSYFHGGLRELLLNGVYWLTDREVPSASPTAPRKTARVALDPRTDRAVFWTVVIVLPACAALAGLAAFVMRRR